MALATADGAEGVRRALLDALGTTSASRARVRDLFSSWDLDQSGSIDKSEWYNALLLVGLDCGRRDADALFTKLDTDGSGALDYREIYSHLQREIADAAPPLAPALLPGAAGEIEVEALNAIPLRMEGAGPAQVLGAAGELDAAQGISEPGLRELLVDALAARYTRVRDLFVECARRAQAQMEPGRDGTTAADPEVPTG